MLCTPCEICCFGDREKRGCRAGQYCMEDGETFAAPGFCRMFRGPAWVKRQQEKGESPDLGNLVGLTIDESKLKYDLMVLYDERIHTPEMLRLTLSAMTDAEMNIIANMGGGGTRGSAVEVAKERDKPYRVEHMLDPKIVGVQAIDEAVRLVASPYFVVVEAGRRIMGLDQLRTSLCITQSRAVYWHFPFYVGKTAMVAPRTGMGVYLNSAYQRLGGNQEKSFREKLVEYEDKSGWSLSWFCERGAIV